jgi:hypothetical protein
MSELRIPDIFPIIIMEPEGYVFVKIGASTERMERALGGSFDLWVLGRLQGTQSTGLTTTWDTNLITQKQERDR